MAKIITEMNKVYELLSVHKFTTIGNVNDDFKCGICKNILINAHQAICGCNFCYTCINQYMSNDVIDCPNNTEECSSESLLNIFPNPIFNKRISKLIVRCPNKLCSHESQLIEMGNHLNSCSKTIGKCLFYDLGCERDDIITEKLNDHMLSDIHNHNKMLIDLIGNLQNEIRQLELKGNQLDIKMPKTKDSEKDEIIESLREEIKLIKQENKDLIQKIEIRDRNLSRKFDNIDIDLNDSIKSINDEMKLMKVEQKKLEEQIKMMGKNFDEKCDKKICIIKRELITNSENEKVRLKNENERFQRITNQMIEIDKYLDIRDDGMLWGWYIGKIIEIKGVLRSAAFCTRKCPYQLQFNLENIDNELNIGLEFCRTKYNAIVGSFCQVKVELHLFALNNNDKSLTFSKLFKSHGNEGNLKISHFYLETSNFLKIDCKISCRIEML